MKFIILFFIFIFSNISHSKENIYLKIYNELLTTTDFKNFISNPEDSLHDFTTLPCIKSEFIHFDKFFFIDTIINEMYPQSDKIKRRKKIKQFYSDEILTLNCNENNSDELLFEQLKKNSIKVDNRVVIAFSKSCNNFISGYFIKNLFSNNYCNDYFPHFDYIERLRFLV